jgi:threonine synthase
VAVGHGSLLLGLHTGFKELQNAGIIGRIPRIVGVQAANCAPLYKAFAENLNVIPRIARRATIAEGVSIAEPYRGKQILEAVRQSGGTIIAVDEAEIEDSLKQAGQKGFYIEPTSAVATAGLRRYLQQHEPSGTVVSVFTGHGLKATEKILQLLKS